MESVLTARGLRQGYRATEVVHELDLDLFPGITGLLGPNGAGKSTLLRTLATASVAWAGDLRIGGEAIDSVGAVRRARRRIGYLPQDFGYYPAFSVADFVTYAAWLREVPKRGRREAVRQALELVGMADRADVKMKALSGGMRQRVGLAWAVVGAPPLIILDEPTVGLDPEQRVQFRELLTSLEGSAVVLSTHLIEDIAATCSRVAVLADGRIKFIGAAAELAAHGGGSEADAKSMEEGYLRVLHTPVVAAS
ncbi:ATP-binding cassette domain-containing protein [Polymorphospora rubra]|uniref:ATP-binding cassette domain-containing protein n=1 Tax=Polymorphospora rubra TaxID=338584 RepID=UPI003406F52A